MQTMDDALVQLVARRRRCKYQSGATPLRIRMVSIRASGG
jgi:hypothetical protein